MNGASDSRVLDVVRMTDRLPQAVIELVAIDDDLLRMHGFDGAERDREITGVLDVDDQFRYLPCGLTWRTAPKGLSPSETKTSKPSWTGSLAIAVSSGFSH